MRGHFDFRFACGCGHSWLDWLPMPKRAHRQKCEECGKRVEGGLEMRSTHAKVSSVIPACRDWANGVPIYGLTPDHPDYMAFSPGDLQRKLERNNLMLEEFNECRVDSPLGVVPEHAPKENIQRIARENAERLLG